MNKVLSTHSYISKVINFFQEKDRESTHKFLSAKSGRMNKDLSKKKNNRFSNPVRYNSERIQR